MLQNVPEADAGLLLGFEHRDRAFNGSQLVVRLRVCDELECDSSQEMGQAVVVPVFLCATVILSRVFHLVQICQRIADPHQRVVRNRESWRVAHAVVDVHELDTRKKQPVLLDELLRFARNEFLQYAIYRQNLFS